MVDACPYCDNSTINRRIRATESEGFYRCTNCHRTFNEPVTRLPKKGGRATR